MVLFYSPTEIVQGGLFSTNMSFPVSGVGLHIAIGKGVVFVTDDGGEGQKTVLTQSSPITHAFIWARGDVSWVVG